MTVTLETLDLCPGKREASREIIRRIAYFHWLGAGRPEGRDLEFWLKAESEWIGTGYVPERECDGTRP